MSTRKLQFPVSGFTGGLNLQASTLTVIPSELSDGTINVDLESNGSVRRRKGADFIGANSVSGDYMQTVRTGTPNTDPFQAVPSATEAELTAPDGNLIRKIIVDIDNEFRVYNSNRKALANFDTPAQTITRTGHSYEYQKYSHLSYATSGDKLYFAGRHIHPGYFTVNSSNDLEVTYFDVNIRNPDSLGNVITLYDKDTIPTQAASYPSTVAFFAGRIWLSGGYNYPNRVLFSQVIAIDTDISSFYQANSPLGATPDVLDDDGGDLYIQGAGRILQLLPLGTSLFVGTTTGVWQIRGDSGIFKANNYATNKVLEDPILSPYSMVTAGDYIVIFGQSAVWKGKINDSLSSTATGDVAFTSTFHDKIDPLYSVVPFQGKQGAVAVYNSAEHKVYYFYNKEYNDFQNTYSYNGEPGYNRNALVFDTRKDDSVSAGSTPGEPKRTVDEAFVPYEFSNNAAAGLPYIACPFVGKTVPFQDPVVVNGVSVVVDDVSVVSSGTTSGGDVVYCIFLSRSTSGSVVTTKGAIGKLKGQTLKDWSLDQTLAQSYDSIAVSGFQTFGNVGIPKGATYLYFVFKKVETGTLDSDGVDSNPGGCFVRTSWQWAANANSPHYGSQKQIYVPDRFVYSHIDNSDDGFSHTWYNLRCRGRGEVLQVRFENDGDKDFHLIGWSQTFYGVTK